MHLNDMTFESPTRTHVPPCATHGDDCLGHAVRTSDDVPTPVPASLMDLPHNAPGFVPVSYSRRGESSWVMAAVIRDLMRTDGDA